ncbi:MAG: TetR/AcrR family transcriptional regulator [Burkholderiaceae bacterium]|nr:TetR/AcrR family transcriptional regulator [Burkholderiaceae bacterium]
MPAAKPSAKAPAKARPVRRGRPPKTTAERDEGNRRQALIGAAARLFRLKGFDGASTRDIAAAADMQSGSPFYFFDSKPALLHAVMQEGMARATRSQAQALAALPARAPAHDKLRALVRNHFEVLLGVGSDFIPVMLYEWRSLTPVQRQDIAAQKDAYEAVWMPTLRALRRAGALKGRPEVARLFIFGALNWAPRWFSSRGPLSLDELTAQALLLFTRES